MLDAPLTPEVWASIPPRNRDLFDLAEEVRRGASPELKNLVHFTIKQHRKKQWHDSDPNPEDERYWKHWRDERALNADTLPPVPDPDLEAFAKEILPSIKVAPRVDWSYMLKLYKKVRDGDSLTSNDEHDLLNIILTALKDARRWHANIHWQELDFQAPSKPIESITWNEQIAHWREVFGTG